MKKRVLTILLAFCLVLTLLPTVAMAADPIVISTLDELLDSFSQADGYILIDSDTTVTGEIDTWETECYIRIMEDVTLTIADGGKIISGCDNNGTIVVEAGGSISTTMGSHIVNNGTIVVEIGSSISATKGGNIINNGTITVNEGGQLTTGRGGGLKNQSGSTVTMNGTFYLATFLDEETEHAGNVMMYYEEGEEAISEGTGKICILAADDVDISNIVPEITAYFDTCTFTRSTEIGAEETPIELTSIDAEPIVISTLDELLNSFSQADGYILIDSDTTVTGEIDTWETECDIRIMEDVTLTIADGGKIISGCDNNGAVVVEAGGSFSAMMDGNIVNNGTITVNEGGQLITGMGGQLKNQSGSTVTINGTFYLATFWGKDTEYGKKVMMYYEEGEGAISEGTGKVCILAADDADISKIVPEITAYFDTCTFTRSTEIGAEETPIGDEPAVDPALTVCPQDETCVYAKFTDADTKAWYHDGVHFCVENGYMQGVSATAFGPSGTTTRAMIVTMLWRMEGEPVVNYAMTFKDVKADQWCTEAIRWAQSTGVVEGYSAEAFGPNDPITREQMATILYRYAKYHEIDTANTNTLAGFTDTEKVSAWALDAMRWANAAGLIQGRTATTLVPRVSITRAEAATMVQRYCKDVREN